MAALTTALHKREQLDAEIESLFKRKDALETLIQADYPHKGRQVLERNTTVASAIVNLIQPTVTGKIRSLLALSSVPLTSGEIHEKLKAVGEPLSEKTNPWALIHGICRRLVDQKFAREVDKDGRKAWALAK